LLAVEKWRRNAQTLHALALLQAARFLVHRVPLKTWRRSLGFDGNTANVATDDACELAASIERASRLSAIEIKCLPQAMALSWMLRRRRIAHAIVVAVRPASQRDSPDALHAWVEVAGSKIIGDLPGPWVETLRLKGQKTHSRRAWHSL
jgi:hypothetical protein